MYAPQAEKAEWYENQGTENFSDGEIGKIIERSLIAQIECQD